ITAALHPQGPEGAFGSRLCGILRRRPTPATFGRNRGNGGNSAAPLAVPSLRQTSHGHTRPRGTWHWARPSCPRARRFLTAPTPPPCRDNGRVILPSQEGRVMFEPVFESLHQATEATIKAQQDLCKKWVGQWTTIPTGLTPGPVPYGDQAL